MKKYNFKITLSTLLIFISRLILILNILIISYIIISFIYIYFTCEYGWKNYYYTFISPGRENFKTALMFLENKDAGLEQVKIELALHQLKKALNKDNNLLAASFCLGQIYTKLNDSKKAIFYLEMTFNKDKTIKKLYPLLGVNYIKTGRYDEAIYILNLANKNFFPNSQILYLLGYAYEKNNEIVKALDCYDACNTKFTDVWATRCKMREKIILKKEYDY